MVRVPFSPHSCLLFFHFPTPPSRYRSNLILLFYHFPFGQSFKGIQVIDPSLTGMCVSIFSPLILHQSIFPNFSFRAFETGLYYSPLHEFFPSSGPDSPGRACDGDFILVKVLPRSPAHDPPTIRSLTARRYDSA